MLTDFEQKKLAQFVDRKSEMEQFNALLYSPDQPVMAIWGTGGLGKTLLLERMIHECSLRGLRAVRVTWSVTLCYDYLGLMRAIRDGLGRDYADCFMPFNDLVNYFTVPQYEVKFTVDGPISVGENLHAEHTQIGEMVGQKISDNMIVLPRADMAVPESERLVRLTERFFACLSLVVSREEQRGPLIIFLDAVEKMATETWAWILDELASSIIKCDPFSNTRLVLAGREAPKFEDTLRIYISEVELHPLALEHIVELLALRGIAKELREVVAMTIYASTEGKPINVAIAIEKLLRMLAKKSER